MSGGRKIAQVENQLKKTSIREEKFEGKFEELIRTA
jgi:hypothetical protein